MTEQWTTSNEYAERNRFQAYAKKHLREFQSCFANLEKIVTALNERGNLAQIKYGFFRSEGRDIWRISQTGLPHAAETRLYI